MQVGETYKLSSRMGGEYRITRITETSVFYVKSNVAPEDVRKMEMRESIKGFTRSIIR